MRQRSSQSGFALLMALVLVLLAGTVLAGVARRSMVGALKTQGAAEELQRRWAVTSCRATLLGRAEKLLDEAERGRNRSGEPSTTYLHKPMTELRVACRLADMDYELVFTDEQAKLNLNSLLDETSIGEAQSIVARLIVEHGNGYAQPVEVRLRTLALGESSSEADAALLKVGGYGQIFESASPKHLIGNGREAGLVAATTCWGDGRVNLRRASPMVIEQVCEKALGRNVVEALLAARQRDPYRKLPEMLAELDELDEEQRTKVRDYVTDQSTCHGLWVIARGSQRSWYTLAVGLGGSGANDATGEDAGVQKVSQRYEFAW